MNDAIRNRQLNLQDAMKRHQAGDLAHAQKLYDQILSEDPNHPDALHLLGVLKRQQKDLGAAVELISRAIAIRGDIAGFHNNLGNALTDLRRYDEAIVAFTRAHQLKPDSPEVLLNLGTALREAGRKKEAMDAYNRALVLRPKFAELHANIGLLLKDMGAPHQALNACTTAIRLKPDLPEAHNNLGLALKEMGRFDEAAAALRKALSLKPDFVEAHKNLGVVLRGAGKMDEAIAAFREAIRLRPEYAGAHSDMGIALKDQGLVEQAADAFRAAMAADPADHSFHSNLLVTLQFHPEFDGPAILREHQRWAEIYAKPVASSIRPHTNDRNPDRPLRIAYLSPDFLDHPVGRFLVPLLSNHDHANYTIVCYSDVSFPDALNVRLRKIADEWHDTVTLTHEQLAQKLRDDRIDVVVDLALHAANHRLLALARKPAPVQITYLAYAGTSGMPQMDYRITDRFMDPLGENDAMYTEKPLYVTSYWCYLPPENAPAAGQLPMLSAGHVTFGCLNNFAKVSVQTMHTWAQILSGIPGSRLILHSALGSQVDRVRGVFAEYGVDASRLEFLPGQRVEQYYQTYNRIDIALDPFPYNGGTTTCDALWMGCPVIALAGRIAVHRAGVSILSQVGLQELIAADSAGYIAIAQKLAADRDRLSQLRAQMRTRLQSSPLLDGAGHARAMENAYRQAWRAWCAQP